MSVHLQPGYNLDFKGYFDLILMLFFELGGCNLKKVSVFSLECIGK
jgi:hypothetical protein